jgi:formate/nitrite transporter FocA (FNT family)
MHLCVFPAGLSAAHPGLAKLVFSALFPVGLMVTILHGVELYTGDHVTELLLLVHLNEIFCIESAAAAVTVLANALYSSSWCTVHARQLSCIVTACSYAV